MAKQTDGTHAQEQGMEDGKSAADIWREQQELTTWSWRRHAHRSSLAPHVPEASSDSKVVLPTFLGDLEVSEDRIAYRPLADDSDLCLVWYGVMPVMTFESSNYRAKAEDLADQINYACFHYASAKAHQMIDEICAVGDDQAKQAISFELFQGFDRRALAKMIMEASGNRMTLEEAIARMTVVYESWNSHPMREYTP